MAEKLASAAELQVTPGAGETMAAANRTGDPGSYSLRGHILGASDESLVSQWQSFQREHSPDDPMQDPEWLRGYFEGEAHNLSIYSLYRGDRLCGLVPFLKRDWPMAWHLGAWRLAQLPLTRLRLLGSALNLPDDDDAYDLLFSELAKRNEGYDTVFLEDVPVDSYLWGYVHRSHLIRRSFLSYEPDAPTFRPLLRFAGSFDDYMGKFSSKHRKNLLREIKKLRDGALGEMRLVRFESPREVSSFLEKAFALSRKTYQWALYRRGLSAMELISARATFAAQRGWFRSYLLVCGGRSCAFVLGFQYRGRYLLHEIGFDPELAKHSVGTVLLLLVVQDLFLNNQPRILDFESYGKYKEMLSTEGHLQGKLYLFRRRAYSRFLRSGHRSCQVANACASYLIDRFNLRSKLRQRLRGWNVSNAGNASKPDSGGDGR
jgi:hypothetical protein